MNRAHMKALHAILRSRNPEAEIAVIPQQDGAKIVISGTEVGAGVSGPHNGTDVRICMRDDGPLMRFLLNGHL